MRRALTLAERARGRTAPNPMVGAVVVQGGEVVGEGHHARAGQPHAEPLALAAAGGRARGATLYVTLEPCHHTGRTGPCTAAIEAAGIARVVVAGDDTDPRVLGRGVAHLRARGIEVATGVLAGAARRLNAAYHFAQAHGRPLVVAKWAQSLDGCVATAGGHSQWITGAPARAFGHRLRDALDAIAVGRGTVQADDPQLTCRMAGGRDPARVVFDTGALTSPTARVVAQAAHSRAPTIIVCSSEAPLARRQALLDAGAQVQVVVAPAGTASAPLSLSAALAALAQRGLHSVLLEGGPTLLGSAFDGGLVQRAYCFVAPLILGGLRAPHAIGGAGVASLMDGWRMADAQVRRLGRDVLVHGAIRRADDVA